MGLRGKDIEPTSVFGQMVRHPYLWLPPFDIDLFVTAILGTALQMMVGQSLTLVRRGWGGASSINFTMAAGAANNGTVSIVVTGRNEDHDLITETLTIVGAGGSALQTAASGQLFSSVDSIVVSSIIGTLPANNYTVGIGEVANGLVALPNPFRGIPATSIEFTQLGTLGPFLNMVSIAPHNVLGHPVTTTAKMLICCPVGQDPRSFMEN